MLATFAGHLHVDCLRMMGGLPYVQISSASCYWMGKAGASLEHLSAEVHGRVTPGRPGGSPTR